MSAASPNRAGVKTTTARTSIPVHSVDAGHLMVKKPMTTIATINTGIRKPIFTSHLITPVSGAAFFQHHRRIDLHRCSKPLSSPLRQYSRAYCRARVFEFGGSAHRMFGFGVWISFQNKGEAGWIKSSGRLTLCAAPRAVRRFRQGAASPVRVCGESLDNAVYGFPCAGARISPRRSRRVLRHRRARIAAIFHSRNSSPLLGCLSRRTSCGKPRDTISPRLAGRSTDTAMAGAGENSKMRKAESNCSSERPRRREPS